MELKEDYNPYCELCSSCGENSCCSSGRCAYTLMVEKAPKECSYGETYFNDMAFGKALGEDLYEYIMSLPNMHVDMKAVKVEVEEIYDKLYDEIYEK